MDFIDDLRRSAFFDGFSADELRNLLEFSSYSVKEYEKGNIIKNQGDEVKSLGIILKGSVAVLKNLLSGENVIVSRLEAGQTFGEAVIFSKKRTYPADVVSIDDCSVFFLAKECIIRLFTFNTKFLDRYISLLSDRIVMLSEIIEDLSYKSIKEKIANFLLAECSKTKKRVFVLPYTRNEMAEKLNVPRPSLSRELTRLKDTGSIDFHKSTFRVIDPEYLSNILKR